MHDFTIINEFINQYLNDPKLYISRKGGHPHNAWGLHNEQIREVNMYDFFSDHLGIDRTKVKHFLSKTLKEIINTRCELLTPERDGPDNRRSEEMPMFSDINLTPTPTAPGGLISNEIKTLWEILSDLTQWNGLGDIWNPNNESDERKTRYRELYSRIIEMFRHIWERLVAPSMKKIVSDAEDPYTEFGIDRETPVAEMPEPVTELPIETIAKHERSVMEAKYLNNWKKYGITEIDSTYSKMLDRWEKDYIKSYRLGIGASPIPEPPDPKVVTLEDDSSSSSSDEE